jgi:hypothetical protein
MLKRADRAFLKMIGLTLSDAISIGAADLFTARTSCKQKAAGIRALRLGRAFENRLL